MHASPPSPPTLAVIIPAYHEERLLPRTLARIPEHVALVVVVDDGSTDATAEVARAYAAHDPRVEVVVLPENQGVGRAIMAGYAHAAACGAEVLVVMAADDQMDPADLPALVAPIVSGTADYVKGDRLSHPAAHEMPPVRRAGTWALGHLTGAVAGLPGWRDAQCGYTALRASTFAALPEDIYPRYGYPNDLAIRLALLGARVAQVPVRPVYADEQSGLRVRKVILPITGILARGLWRRWRAQVVR